MKQGPYKQTEECNYSFMPYLQRRESAKTWMTDYIPQKTTNVINHPCPKPLTYTVSSISSGGCEAFQTGTRVGPRGVRTLCIVTTGTI